MNPSCPKNYQNTPGTRVACTDLFMLDGTTYLITFDYYSHYPEVIKLNSTTFQTVISALKFIYFSVTMDHNTQPRKLKTSTTSTILQ